MSAMGEKEVAAVFELKDRVAVMKAALFLLVEGQREADASIYPALADLSNTPYSG